MRAGEKAEAALQEWRISHGYKSSFDLFSCFVFVSFLYSHSSISRCNWSACKWHLTLGLLNKFLVWKSCSTVMQSVLFYHGERQGGLAGPWVPQIHTQSCHVHRIRCTPVLFSHHFANICVSWIVCWQAWLICCINTSWPVHILESLDSPKAHRTLIYLKGLWLVKWTLWFYFSRTSSSKCY